MAIIMASLAKPCSSLSLLHLSFTPFSGGEEHYSDAPLYVSDWAGKKVMEVGKEVMGSGRLL